MNDERRPPLAVRPSPDQIARFALLTPEQRFYWLVDTIALCFDLATPEARQSCATTSTASDLPDL